MNEFKKIKNDNETRYVLETMTAGATGASSIATAEKDIGEVQKRVPDAPKPRNFVAKNAKMGGAGKMKDKAKTIPRKEKHKKAIAEGYNGEYDDEAGMAKSNLLTSARAVMGLLKTIKDRDNLPEWGQEKIAKAEMMLVSVWDYLQSQKEMGNDPQVEVDEGAVKDLSMNLKSMTDEEFQSRYKMTKAEARANLKKKDEGVAEVAPPGWEKTVKAMKKHDNIDNPFALAWSMKNKGYKSHKKESADPYLESLAAKVEAATKK